MQKYFYLQNYCYLIIAHTDSIDLYNHWYYEKKYGGREGSYSVTFHNSEFWYASHNPDLQLRILTYNSEFWVESQYSDKILSWKSVFWLIQLEIWIAT